MNQNDQGNKVFPWSEWMESAVKVWSSTAQGWQELSNALAGSPNRSDEYMQASLSVWRSFMAPWTGMTAKQSPQPFMDMGQAIMQVLGSGGLSQEMFKWIWNKGEGMGRTFEELQREAVKSWTGFHEQMIQPFLKVPQVGLTRVYQEKINRFADKFNTYQSAVSEFQQLLSGPIESSFVTMREELDRLKEKGESADDFKVYYGMWIKILEGHYMSLFRSDEYNQALSRLLNETAAFRITGHEVISEFIEFLPVPTNKEMDEVYKELYTLKKQTKEAIKKIRKLESLHLKEELQ